MSKHSVRVGDVMGVPVLPPGRVTVAGNALRAGLGRIHGAMAPPPVRILEGLFGVLDHRVLVALCHSGVPDVLDRPMDLAALASRTNSEPDRLEPLVRYGATRGWLRIDRRGRARPTRTTRFLRRDHPGGWRAWVDFAGGTDVVRAVAELSATSADDPFAAANGSTFFEWMAGHPERGRAFDGAMAAGARMHGLGLDAVLDWSDSARVCDVGGGTGHLLAALTGGGQERTSDHVIDLARRSGFETVNTHRLPSADLAIEFRVC